MVLLVYYSLRGPSQWEFSPDLQLANTPKLKALQAILATPRAAVALGAALPGKIIAQEHKPYNIRSGYGYDYTIDGLLWAAGINLGNFTAYPGHAAAYNGTLSMRGYASNTTQLGVWINGVFQGKVTLAGLSGTAHLSDSTPLAVQVSAGLVVVRLEVLIGSFTLYSISL